MKPIITLFFGIFLVISSYAQYGVHGYHPMSGSIPTYPKSLAGISMDGTKAYAYDFTANDFISMDLPGYSNVLSFNNGDYMGGVDFDSNGDLYGITPGGGTIYLYKEDFGTSTFTNLGTVTGLPSQYFVGLAWDKQTSTMYCLQSSWGSSGSLYRIDLSTRVATLIGTITGMTNGEALAFNSNDRMLYAFNFQPTLTQLLKIDPTTAAASVAGTTTAFLNYDYGWFADCDFNDNTGELIYGLFDYNSSNTNIWSIDPSNCNTTLKATINGTQLVIAINTNGKPVPLKWYYFLLVFMIPIALIVRKRLF